VLIFVQVLLDVIFEVSESLMPILLTVQMQILLDSDAVEAVAAVVKRDWVRHARRRGGLRLETLFEDHRSGSPIEIISTSSSHDHFFLQLSAYLCA
jgi:hypothetical protein